MDNWIDKTWHNSVKKINSYYERIGSGFPHLVENGHFDENPVDWWTNGFWSGILWTLYRNTGKADYRNLAEECEKKLDQVFNDFYGLHHDVGFLWLHTAVANYRITNNPEGRRRGLIAASFLASRFNIRGAYIRAWNENEDNPDVTGWTIIDSMMNIPLLCWATKEDGDPRFRLIAEAHADTVQKHFLRSDGSVHHIVELDPLNGEFVRTFGGQGYAEGSSWSRGQAWGLYGFALAYKNMGHIRYLEASKGIADYFISNLPKDGVPPSDFCCPSEGSYIKDSTAGAIAACGLLELSEHLESRETGKGARYRKAAHDLVRALSYNCGRWNTDDEGLLNDGTVAYHKEHGRNVPIIYGDYFFLEALTRIRDSESFLSFW